MATIGGVAALLQIGVRADTTKATQSLRRMDQTVSKTAANASKLTSAQQRQQSAIRQSTTGMTQYTRATDKAGKENREFERSSAGLTTKLKGIAKGAAAAAAAYVGLGAAKDAVTTTEELAKATLTLNKNLGLSAKTAGGFAAEAKVRNIDTNKLTITTKSYANAVEGAKDATSSQAEAFRALGISTKELKALNPDQLLFAIADGSERLGNTTERTKALGQIFGRSFGPLRPLFTEGAAGLREMIKANTDAGANLGAKGGGIDAIRDLIAEQRQLKRESQGLSVAFTQELAPALIFVIHQLGAYIHFAQQFVDKGLKPIIQWIGKAAAALFNFSHVGFDVLKAFKMFGQGIKDIVGSIPAAIRKAWGGLGDVLIAPFRSAVDKIRGFLSAIIDAINKVPILPDINNPFTGSNVSTSNVPTAGGSSGGQQGAAGKKKQRGGTMVGGVGSGDKIPALLEPGEFVLNRKAVAAIGGGQLNKLNRDVPRFQFGGLVNKAKHLMQGTTGGSPVDLPGLGGLPGWLKPIGEWALGGAAKWIIGKGMGSASAQSVGSGGGSWATYDALAKKWGLSIASTFRPGAITSSGNASYHSMRDGPGRARATDYSDGYATRGEKVFGTKMAKLYGGSLAELIHTPLGFSIKDGQKVAPYATADHYDHVHVAFQKGGGVPQPRHGSHWIKGGSNWSVDEAATLLWQAGLSARYAKQLARVVPNESGGNPRAHNASGATGLFQILGAVVPGNLYDPRINALNAVKKFKDAGNSLSPWVGAPSGPVPNLLMDAIGGNGGGGGGGNGAAGGGGGTTAEKFQTAFPGISLKLLQRLHRTLIGPAKGKLQASVQAAKKAVQSARGPAEKIAAIQGLNAAKGAKVGFLGALATYQKAKKSGSGVRKALEALVTMEQALTAPGEAGDDTSALDTENARITAMNELISQGNLLALQGFQVSASQNPLLGLSSSTFPTQQLLSPLLSSLPTATASPSLAGSGSGSGSSGSKEQKQKQKDIHVHIHKKRGVDDLIDVRIEKKLRKTARKGNRRLPSGRG